MLKNIKLLKKNILFLFVSVALISCAGRDTGYRIVGKDGKVLYLNRKRTEFNKEKLKEQQQKKVEIVPNNTKNNQNIHLVGATNNNGSINNNGKKIDESLALESSAYSLRSVVDTIVKNEDINDIAMTVRKNQEEKTIKDFDIPDYYFNSSKYNIKKASNSVNQSSISSLKNTNSTKNKIEKNKTKFLGGVFFGDEEERIKIAKLNIEQLNNKQPITENQGNVVVSNQNLLKEKYNNDGGLIVLNSAIIDSYKNKQNTLNSSVEKKVNNKKIKKTNNKTNETTSNLEIIPSPNGRIRTLPSNTSSVRSLAESEGTVLVTQQNKVNVKISQNTGLTSKKYYIQIGSFKQENKARKLLNDFIFVGTDTKVVPVEINNIKMYRAVIGTFNTKDEAKNEMKKLLDRGHSDAFIFFKK